MSASVNVSGGVSVRTLPIVVLNDSPRASEAIEHALGGRARGALRIAVLDQFDPQQQPAAAHVADQRMPPLHLAQAVQRARADALGVRHQTLALDDLKRGQRRRGRDRVLLVRVVPERVRAREVEVVARDAGGDRQHAAAERLAEHHDVGRGAVVFSGEEATRLPSPVGISSKISSVPCAWHASRTACQ